MRKAYVIRPAGTGQTAIRVKLTAYRPARPVTLARFRGIPAMALVRYLAGYMHQNTSGVARADHARLEYNERSHHHRVGCFGGTYRSGTSSTI